MSKESWKLDIPIRLSDAEPGEVLRDPDGDLWRRTTVGAEVTVGKGPFAGAKVSWPLELLDEAEDNHGPFTRCLRESL